jgi:hypothetical protein
MKPGERRYPGETAGELVEWAVDPELHLSTADHSFHKISPLPHFVYHTENKTLSFLFFCQIKEV